MKKYKVEISKEKVVIKPTSGHEIDEDLICKIKRHYEHDGIFKPIKKELPKTWEEFCCLGHNKLKGQIEVSGSMCDEFTALWKLVLLRDHYNNGWVPDWKTSEGYRSIIFNCDKAILAGSSKLSHVLTFKSESLANEFLSNFAQLIETAKSLL